MKARDSSRQSSAYPDSEKGARDLIADMTVFAPQSIVSVERDRAVKGCWIVSFPKRQVRAYVGTHPLASDFELVREAAETKSE